jgi:putative peptide zinc metalloprotease protein
LLLFQLGMILLHIPRILATAWHSLGQQRHTVSTALGKGDVLAAGVGILQTLILVLPIVGMGLSFGRLGKRIGAKAWTATDGSPVGRLALCVVTAAAVGGLAYTWIPNGDYKPIGPGERGTLSEGVAAVSQVATGRPSLLPEQRAVERGDQVPVAKESEPDAAPGSSPSTTTPTTAVKGGTATTVVGTSTTVRRSTNTTLADEEPSTTTTTRVRSTTTTAAP